MYYDGHGMANNRGDVFSTRKENEKTKLVSGFLVSVFFFRCFPSSSSVVGGRWSLRPRLLAKFFRAPLLPPPSSPSCTSIWLFHTCCLLDAEFQRGVLCFFLLRIVVASMAPSGNRSSFADCCAWRAGLVYRVHKLSDCSFSHLFAQ